MSNNSSVRLRQGDSKLLPRLIEGVSPEVSFAQTDDGLKMIVTTKSGTKEVFIPKGPKGDAYELTEADRYAIAGLFDNIRIAAVTFAKESEGFAVGQQSGEDVGSDSPYYHNNAKFYKQKIEDLGVAATTLETGEDASVIKTVDQTTGDVTLTFGLPKGDKGDKGEQGDPAPQATVEAAVDDWLDENITNPDSPPLDRSLSSSYAAAPADMVGELKSAFNDLNVYNEIDSGNSIDVSDYAGETIPKVTSEISVSSAASQFQLYCCGKNHCMVPNDTVSQYGLTRTWNSDGTITLNGTPDRNVSIPLGTALGVYYTNWRMSIQKSSANEGVNLRFNGTKYSESLTWNGSSTAYFNNVDLLIDKNTVLENYVVRPMLEFAPYSETIVYEAFSGFIKTYTFDEAVTSGSIDWGNAEIPEDATTLWMYDTGNVSKIYETKDAGQRLNEIEESVAELSENVDGAYSHKYVETVDGWSDQAVSYESGFINGSGTVTSNDGFRHSNYIPCKPNDLVEYNLYGYSDQVYIVTFYNSAKSRLSGIVGETAYKVGYTLVPANTAYVVFSTSNGKTGSFSIGELQTVTGDEAVAEVKSYADGLVSVSDENVTLTRGDVPVVRGKIYTKDNGVYSLDAGRMTDYIPVSEGDTIKYRLYNYIGTSVKQCAIAVFNSEKSRIDYVLSEKTGWVSGTYTIPENGAYAIISWEYGMTYDGWFEITVASYSQTLADMMEKQRNIPDSVLKGKQWCCLGDSITYGANTTNVYHKFIGERCALTAYNFGESNTAIAKKTDATTNAMVTRYTDMYDDVDYVTVFGGTNDHGQNIPIGEWGDSEQTTLYGAMKALCDGLTAKYIGKKIGFILPLPKYTQTGGVYTDYSYPNASFTPYIECIHDVCKRYSIPVLDLYLESGLSVANADVRTAMIPDGLHPNATGHEYISRKIQTFLESL